MNEFSLIVAMDENRGIGLGGKLPWHISADLKYFKKITSQTQDPLKQNVMIMGRRTWESVPEHLRPLANRISIVLTQNLNYKVSPAAYTAASLDAALQLLRSAPFKERFESVFVIGGAAIFKIAIDDKRCRKAYITHINGKFPCDTFFPAFKDRFRETSKSPLQKDGPHRFYFAEYERI